MTINYKVALTARSKPHSEHRYLANAIEEMYNEHRLTGKEYHIYKRSTKNPSKWVRI